jgi:hypothetical protein
VPTATPSPTPIPTPTFSPVAFNDYTTFGYDNQRDVFNPNSVTLTPGSVANLHLAWQISMKDSFGGSDYNTQSQPILATEIKGHQGVLYAGGGSGIVDAYDATTGATIWSYPTGQMTYTCGSNGTSYFGVGGSAAYDPNTASLYIIGSKNASLGTDGTNTLFHIDGTTGALDGSVNFATPNPVMPSEVDFSHTSVTLSNGTAYVGTSASCDTSSWRGRVAAVSVPSMTLANTYFTVWNSTTQPWGGGGVWGWGGVSLDGSGNVYTGVGNTDDGETEHGTIQAPFSPAPEEYSGNGDAFIKLSSDISTLEDSAHPIPTGAYNSGMSKDLDLNGTPAIFTPNGVGCDPLAAVQGKSGSMYLFDTTNLAQGPLTSYPLAPSSYDDGFLGGPTYSPATGLLYVNVTSTNNSMLPPGMIAIDPGCTTTGAPSVAWTSQFGPDSYPYGLPRSVPSVSAGGVIFVASPCMPSGNSCASTTTTYGKKRARGPVHQICCAPPTGGAEGGALWMIDASTGNVLNGGLPLLFTDGPPRAPPTIDGDWVFVLDYSGNLYGLTTDASYAPIQSQARPVSPKMLHGWDDNPFAHRQAGSPARRAGP